MESDESRKLPLAQISLLALGLGVSVGQVLCAPGARRAIPLSGDVVTTAEGDTLSSRGDLLI